MRGRSTGTSSNEPFPRLAKSGYLAASRPHQGAPADALFSPRTIRAAPPLAAARKRGPASLSRRSQKSIIDSAALISSASIQQNKPHPQHLHLRPNLLLHSLSRRRHFLLNKQKHIGSFSSITSCLHLQLRKMSLASKLSITDVDVKGKRVLIRVSLHFFSTKLFGCSALSLSSWLVSSLPAFWSCLWLLLASATPPSSLFMVG